jgi:hypothetical protein
MSASPPILERYLGDGVYATFDGYAVTLKTQRWTEENLPVDHFLVFEPRELQALEKFVADVWLEFKKATDTRQQTLSLPQP